MPSTTRFRITSGYQLAPLVEQGLEADWTQHRGYSVRRRIRNRRASSRWHAGITGVSTAKTDQDSLKDKLSGIKDKCSEVVVNKHLYPHATLQQEFLWGWDGNDIEYKDLTFGLLLDLTNKQECRQRLDILRLTAYRSQYVKWQTLVHLYTAIIRKIQWGLAIWDSNFDKVEKMVLENPGQADWGSQLSMRKGTSGNENKPSGPLRRGDAASTANRGTCWCRKFQLGTCSKSAPHTKNIRGREMMVKHLCAKCFQKDGAEQAHSDRDPVCPHAV